MEMSLKDYEYQQGKIAMRDKLKGELLIQIMLELLGILRLSYL